VIFGLKIYLPSGNTAWAGDQKLLTVPFQSENNEVEEALEE
jgi:hypothetical protein